MKDVHAPNGALRSEFLVGGRWSADASGGTLDHVNPSTGRVQATFPLAGPSEIDDAVAAARAAFPSWRHTTASARQAVLNRIGELIREHSEELAADQ